MTRDTRIYQSNCSRYPSFTIRLGELPWAIRVRRNAYENVASNLLLVWNMMSDFLPFLLPTNLLAHLFILSFPFYLRSSSFFLFV
jgi:hypothetical protein